MKEFIMKTYRFDIDIDCPGCAAKVERALKEDARFESAVLDFAGKKLTVTTDLSAEEVKKLAVSVSDAAGNPTSISLNPISTSIWKNSSFSSRLIGSINA